MKRKILLTIILLLWSSDSHAGIAVVVNTKNPIKHMSKQEITDLFMGRYRVFPDGNSAIPLDHPSKSKVREQFYKHFTGKTVSQINAYWAKLIFSGRAVPPQVAPRSESVIDMISDNQSTISYIDTSHVTPDVKVIYTTDGYDD